MRMIGAVIVMMMMTAMVLERDEIDLTELHAAFRERGLCQTANRLARPA